MWPFIEPIQGLKDTKHALALLLRVSEALMEARDFQTMPDDLSRFLLTMSEGKGIEEDRYINGAQFVRDHLERWRSPFDQSFGTSLRAEA